MRRVPNTVPNLKIAIRTNRKILRKWYIWIPMLQKQKWRKKEEDILANYCRLLMMFGESWIRLIITHFKVQWMPKMQKYPIQPAQGRMSLNWLKLVHPDHEILEANLSNTCNKILHWVLSGTCISGIDLQQYNMRYQNLEWFPFSNNSN